MSQDDSNTLPVGVAELQALLLQSRQEVVAARTEIASLQTAAKREAAVQRQTIVEMSATIATQQQQLEKNRVTIEELLAALRGKTRERIDPRQLLLFDAGELEALIREQTEDAPEAGESLSAAKKRKKKRLCAK